MTLANMVGPYPSDAWDLLSPSLTKERQHKLEQTARQRTNHIRLVIQDITDPHNISACLRSAEAFGVQRVDVVNDGGAFRPSTVARGVASWLHVTAHSSIEGCAQQLHRDGYQIACGFPESDTATIAVAELDISQPIAVVFGNEHAGIHDTWKKFLDIKFTIPMVGLVESLNISVSCAVSLFSLTSRAKALLGDDYPLNPAERSSVLNEWVCKQFKSHDLMLKRLRT